MKRELGRLCIHCSGIGTYPLRDGMHALCHMCKGWRVISQHRARMRQIEWYERPEAQAQIVEKHYELEREWIRAMAEGTLKPTHWLIWYQPTDVLDPITQRMVLPLVTEFMDAR